MSKPLILYHGSTTSLPGDFQFQCLADHRGGIHLGTIEQARMRAGKGPVLEVAFDIDQHAGSVPRVRDQSGYWTELLKRRAKRGQRALIYLNRYEGITTETAIALAAIDSDSVERMSDREFIKHAPEAQDSYVILDLSLVRVLRILPTRLEKETA